MRNLVSIIIPCYKQAQYLPDALDSILSQTYSYWECIIVNDGSPDNTEQVTQEWLARDSRFKYIKKENGGLSSARNAGLRAAIGEYIQLLDADDVLERNKINYQLNYLNDQGGGIDILVSGYRYFQDSDKTMQLLIFGPAELLPEVTICRDDKKDLVKLFAKRNPMVVSAPLYHKKVFQKIGYFDEELSANEDWDFHFRCAANGVVFQHCGCLPETRTLIRLHPGSMITDMRNMINSLRQFQDKHADNLIFASENRLMIKKRLWMEQALYFLKFFVPPAFIWLIRRFQGLASDSLAFIKKLVR